MRGTAAGLTAAALALVVGAACGGDDRDEGVASLDENAEADGGSDDGGPEELTEEQVVDAALAYDECMQEQGIDMPDPFSDPEGVTIFGPPNPDAPESPHDEMPEGWEEADPACRPILDEVAPFEEPSAAEVAEHQDQMLAHAACMRERGYDEPDPVFGDDGMPVPPIEPAPVIDVPLEQYLRDLRECVEATGGEMVDDFPDE